MTVEKFITQYKLTTEEKRDEFIRKHINDKYIPYSSKISLCETIINISMYKNGKFHASTPIQYLLFVLHIIDEYTDISINFDVYSSEYDRLNENNLINKILDNINEYEFREFNIILKMMVDDLYKIQFKCE